ncbi:hypothetical protein C2E23DRAFT_742842 [Lenzites betulinus]|nr:hypothetical protein C2E23DRAFT_742842 [Lenzites betulinus]
MKLFDTRLSVILERGLARHSLLFDRLLPQNMSGDETDGETRALPMVYRIVESRWQSIELKTFLRALDAKYRHGWEKPRPGQRATGGNPPRTRVLREGSRVEDGYAPAGLWRNCYDPDWLRGLEPYQRRALKIIGANYDFDMTPHFAEDEAMGEEDGTMNEDDMDEEDEDDI